MWRDPIVEEVRKARDELAAEFGYDIDKIVENARSRQGTDGRAIASFAIRRHGSSEEDTGPVAAPTAVTPS